MPVLRVDVDGVLVEERSAFERTLARPIEGASDVLWQLRADGYEIAIETARGWQERKVTERQLADLDIPWDQMYLGKQIAAATIDDRAIKFLSWDEIPLRLRFPDEDDFLIHIHRQGTKNFLEWIATQDLMEPIVEIGPMSLAGDCNGVFEKHRDTFVDSRTLFAGKHYLSMDVDPSSRPDVVGDFMDAVELLGMHSVGSLVMMNSLEHMAFWDAPRIIVPLLRTGGRLYCCTPWNFRLHAPRPLAGYLSDDGYQMLFGEQYGQWFKVESVEKIPCPNRPLHPVGFKVVVVKK